MRIRHWSWWMLACAGVATAQSVSLTKEGLIERHPDLRLENVSDSPVDGLYEVNVGGVITYVSKDGRFQIRGDVIDLDARRNLTEARRAENRATELAAVDTANEIVFAPANGAVKHRVFVFTDVDCGYCRQLHREIEAITALGIEVRYLAYPRTGPNTESWTKAERVWCTADRNAALTRAKLGAETPPNAECRLTTVAEQYSLGRRVGVTGTPAVYAATGEELGGYLKPAALLEQLEKVAKLH